MKTNNYFTLQELTRSATAQRLHIDNTPGAAQCANLQRLVDLVLLPARIRLGLPIAVSSGYRCPRLNAAVGGVPNSQHLQGLAADLLVLTAPPLRHRHNLRLFAILRTLPVDQLIAEHLHPDHPALGWLHVSIAPAGTAPRHQILIRP